MPNILSDPFLQCYIWIKFNSAQAGFGDLLTLNLWIKLLTKRMIVLFDVKSTVTSKNRYNIKNSEVLCTLNPYVIIEIVSKNSFSISTKIQNSAHFLYLQLKRALVMFPSELQL